MKFKTLPTVAPIKFTYQGDEFTLMVKPPRDDARMAIVNAAVSGSFEVVQAAVRPMVVNWIGIIDTQEPPVPVAFELPDREGRPAGNRFSEFLSQIDLDLQFEIIGALLTFAGLSKYAERLLSAVPALTGKGVNLDPTSTLPSTTSMPPSTS